MVTGADDQKTRGFPATVAQVTSQLKFSFKFSVSLLFFFFFSQEDTISWPTFLQNMGPHFNFQTIWQIFTQFNSNAVTITSCILMSSSAS
jgi:hypothetical protein